MHTSDSRAERFLDSVGAKYSYENDLPFPMLATGWDSKNLGRSQVRVEKAILEYKGLMDNGSPAPAPIVWKKNGRYEVLDGLQRMCASMARDETTFNAYVVHTNSERMAHAIRVVANKRLQGGHQESNEWSLEQAIVELVLTGEKTAEELANWGAWPVGQVRDKTEAIEFRNLVEGAGGPERMTDSVLKVIAKHASRSDFVAAPAPIARFTNAVKRMKLSTEDAMPYIEEFFNVPRDKGKLFEKFENNWHRFLESEGVEARLNDPDRHHYSPMTPEGKLNKTIRATLTTAEKLRDDHEKIPHMAEYFQLLNKIRAAMQQIEKYSKGAKKRG
jgi:hypothetical protein